MKGLLRKIVVTMIFSMSSMAAFAADVPTIDTGDTAWVLIASALVMLMTPGLAFFYGGLVRRKNMLSVLMQCFMILAVISLQWVLFGYSLSFAPGNGFIGGLQWLGLNGVELSPYSDYSATIPHQAFMIFQAMFAIITPALIIGAFAERMKFSTMVVFTLLWSTLVYAPVAHWVWGIGGWLRNLGALDFAGGTVVHINAGIAALVCALVIGKRKNYKNHPTHPHNLPFSVLGAGLLWFGWFGFNAGSSLSANGLAVNAFVVTNTAAAAAALSWACIEWFFAGKPTMLGTITGAVAGLVAITPAAGFVNIMGAIAIGLMVSVICYVFVGIIKPKLGYDDTLDAFGVHGIGGIWGALATGLFATKAVNSAGADGLFYGNAHQFIVQLEAVAITVAFSFVVTFVILKVLDMIMGVRVSENDELLGLDLSQHNERAYTLVE
ncbi:MAG: ammonia channel protein [Candidatus Margulisiibacteriota bacterium]|nr:MAG: ammonia channel protein [Candidatus Margulisbacteria bacterium GWD2_39_127]OGI08538.1 MAG: ammonia channel protein [Candidatus Margulisbacteria bacterium GWE2_39_32]PZM78189.1 MAG: ammonia channel protein [Candidatus Margulisiibacteriota bacterium]HAR63450.1 ammonia channel protein [Candidatus Margulisiibacteriota bacterium]HCT85608.1 ammonia channel protein [Candidatus Margulisiibacteriota bacterium]